MTMTHRRGCLTAALLGAICSRGILGFTVLPPPPTRRPFLYMTPKKELAQEPSQRIQQMAAFLSETLMTNALQNLEKAMLGESKTESKTEPPKTDDILEWDDPIDKNDNPAVVTAAENDTTIQEKDTEETQTSSEEIVPSVVSDENKIGEKETTETLEASSEESVSSVDDEHKIGVESDDPVGAATDENDKEEGNLVAESKEETVSTLNEQEMLQAPEKVAVAADSVENDPVESVKDDSEGLVVADIEETNATAPPDTVSEELQKIQVLIPAKLPECISTDFGRPLDVIGTTPTVSTLTTTDETEASGPSSMALSSSAAHIENEVPTTTTQEPPTVKEPSSTKDEHPNESKEVSTPEMSVEEESAEEESVEEESVEVVSTEEVESKEEEPVGVAESSEESAETEVSSEKVESKEGETVGVLESSEESTEESAEDLTRREEAPQEEVNDKESSTVVQHDVAFFRKQPKSPEEEAEVAARYAKLSLGDRAFCILRDLGMV